MHNSNSKLCAEKLAKLRKEFDLEKDIARLKTDKELSNLRPHQNDTAWYEAKFKFDGTFIAVPMPDYVNCAVIKLFVTGKSGKAIGPDRFYQRDRMCGDPESSFEDLSDR